VLVLAIGALMHKPLSRVPENTLKFVVGIMMCAYGTFWTGEGIGVEWPGGDWALLILV
jgi:Ca2+/H+ antiporter, TMEM165/GDT1 family